ncbi:sulfatase family protein [Echinicola rosea]|uniref:Arylsulfatase n=1 Tax=Echinicola rosea TaxID=1807691 RepID=A0ABQ1UH78_9BACT|nr:arylsulfatase [Echinicola rosea]GGF18055.1 arylsulfatase [Echinicola rosea]
MEKHIKGLTFVLVTLALYSCSNGGKKENAPTPPNIIYILADDMGVGDIQAFNPDGKIKTPHLDQLAADGMRFTDAHTSSSVCTPTRYGIMTGRYNWRSTLKSGVLWGDAEGLIDTARATVPSILHNQGYHTAYVGKWHLGWNWAHDEDGNIDFTKPITHNPNDNGFDYAYGHVASLDIPPYVYVENGKVTALPVDSTESTDKYGWWRKGATGADFDHEDVTPNFFRRSIKYVQDRAASDKPFFLYLPLPSPHSPILPTAEWQGKSGLNPYGDFVMMVDDYVGQLVASVKEAGIEENTLFIFVTDNGCSPASKPDELIAKGHHPSGPYRGFKADIYEGGHRVPFIAKWPRIIKAGTVNTQTICTTDLMATCAEIVGYQLKDDEGEDSYSLLPLFEGQDLSQPFREATVHHSINGSFAIRKGDWKLAMCPGSGGWSFPTPKEVKEMDSLPPVQLYNLKEDPAETNNLQSTYPAKVEELKQLLTQYITEGRSTSGKPQTNDGNGVWDQLWWMK